MRRALVNDRPGRRDVLVAQVGTSGLREGVYRMAVPAASRHVRIESARLGDQAALRGAATAAIEQALHPGRIDALMP